MKQTLRTFGPARIRTHVDIVNEVAFSIANRSAPGSVRYKLVSKCYAEHSAVLGDPHASAMFNDKYWCLSFVPLSEWLPFDTRRGYVLWYFEFQRCISVPAQGGGIKYVQPQVHPFVIVFGLSSRETWPSRGDSQTVCGVYATQEPCGQDRYLCWEKLREVIERNRANLVTVIGGTGRKLDLFTYAEPSPDGALDQSWLRIECKWPCTQRTDNDPLIVVTLSMPRSDLPLIETLESQDGELKMWRERVHRFGPPMSDTCVLDIAKFNIALIGTNNTGKSSLANFLLGGSHSGPESFAEVVQAYLSSLTGPGAQRVLDEQQKSIFASHATGEGETTTWAMMADSACNRDVSAWFHNAVLWDLPGLQLSDMGPYNYVKKTSLNYFDAVIMCCDRQFSIDDFHMMCFLQNAITDNTPKIGGIPFFIVRTKVDIAITGHFKSDVVSCTSRWRCPFGLLSNKLREEMLTNLAQANSQIADFDSHYEIVPDVALVSDRFHFSGRSEDVATCESGSYRLPLAEFHKVHTFFEREICRLRHRLFMLSCGKGLDVQGNLFQVLCQAVTKIPRPICGVEDYEEVVLSVSTGEIGFSVRNQVVQPPRRGQDLRVQHGLQHHDEIIEFPLGRRIPYTVSEDDLKKMVLATPRPFEILVKRVFEGDAERSFRTSNFKKLYVTDSAVDLPMYDQAVFDLMSTFADEHGLTTEVAKQWFDLFKKERGETELHKIAGCDWTSYMDLKSEGNSYGEFCSVVCSALRKDKSPNVNSAAIFVQALRGSIIHTTDRFSLRHWPPSLQSFRGVAMPRDSLTFYQVGTKFRSPMPLATSKHEHMALFFMHLAHQKNIGLSRVMFIIDLSEMPVHVAHIEYSKLPNEGEFLFMPYSCFRVTSIAHSNGFTKVNLFAYRDNLPQPGETADSEAWGLAEWS